MKKLGGEPHHPKERLKNLSQMSLNPQRTDSSSTVNRTQE